MTDQYFTSAHQLLQQRVSGDYKSRAEDPEDPSTVQAMQIAINLPKQDPPSRNAVLNDAARAAVAVCLDPRAGQEGFWRAGLDNWYSHRIRKVARRARNKAWEDVQALPGVTIGSVRAFVPSAVADVPHEIAKLQIKGTELEPGEELPLDAAAPLVALDASLQMSAGKAAAQVGHASMLLAAARDTAWVRQWADAGFPLNVRELPREQFAEIAARPGAVPVRDAGFTEVAPGSITAVAIA
ncbi:peptidyl-tRNA hydrolase [Corynebacterium fournieri]|uniref:peptidyl-tRNA hydrolase n=1 Tax=Corynebacterium fournieri TaxID=1852390 RepID=UPI000A2F7A01|nr:peptidyl-tRNA hydrolase [Corynebacterium fournieri]WJY98196.1 peptidyl-tRNA hydrolase [Corynebacterium fournieri]